MKKNWSARGPQPANFRDQENYVLIPPTTLLSFKPYDDPLQEQSFILVVLVGEERGQLLKNRGEERETVIKSEKAGEGGFWALGFHRGNSTSCWCPLFRFGWVLGKEGGSEI